MCSGDETVKVKDVELVDYLNAGGLMASMFKVVLHLTDGSCRHCVFNTLPTARHATSVSLGLAREVFFYENFSKTVLALGISIPRVLYAYGNMKTGEKSLLMEDLEHTVQVGYFYGSGSPLNWNKDLDKITHNAVAASKMAIEDLSVIVTVKAFVEVAKLHAAYWKTVDLLEMDWLKSTDWYKGKDYIPGQETWEAARNRTIDQWNSIRSTIVDGSSEIHWNSNLVDCLDLFFSTINWEIFQADIQQQSWTLIHGDFHPANMLWESLSGDDIGRVILLDWEMVAIGNGPLDLGQFVISHMTSEYRRKHESFFLHKYYEALSSRLPVGVTYSYEQCFREYVQGGATKWIWLLPVLCTICPTNIAQYFHDQLASFLIDHDMTTDTFSKADIRY